MTVFVFAFYVYMCFLILVLILVVFNCSFSYVKHFVCKDPVHYFLRMYRRYLQSLT